MFLAGGRDNGNYLEYGQPDLIQNPPLNNNKLAIALWVKAGAKNTLVGTFPDMRCSPCHFGTKKQAKAF